MSTNYSFRTRLRAAGTVATGSLRLYWAGAVVAVVLGITGLSVLMPIRSMGQPSRQSEPRLLLPPIPAADAGVAATASSIEPGGLQARAVQQLYELLLILGWAALLIVSISMITRFAAQAAGRGPEIGVRRAAGASRKDLVMSLLGEGGILLLVILGVGLPASWLLLRLSLGSWPGTAPGVGLLPLSAVLSVGLVVVGGVLAPLRYAGARHMRSPSDGQVLLAVPAFQLAMSLAILLGSAALLDRAAPTESSARAEFGAPSLLLSLDSGVTSPEARSRGIETLLARVAGAPGIARVSLASPGTVLGLGRVDDTTTDCGRCSRGGIQLRYDLHTATHFVVSPDTFASQGIRVVEGRGFTSADGWGTERVALVSRHLAVSGFESAGAVGRSLFLGNDWPNRPYKVIGVVEDVGRAGLGSALEPLDTIYLSVLQHPPKHAELHVTASQGMSDTTVAGLVQASLGDDWTARSQGPPAEILASAVLPSRWFGRWFAGVGVVVLLAAIAGTFGAMRMWVEAAVAEVAARRAVGATRLRIVAWVLGNTAGVGLKGVLVGVFLYFSVLRVSLTNLVGQLPGADLQVVAGLACLLLIAALMGAVIPTATLLRRPIASLFT